jgi:hypothetical protein
LYGSAIELESEATTELSTRAICPVDYTLIERQKAAKAALDRRGMQPKRLILENPDYPEGAA